jgi:hypothetical protein
MNKYKKLNKNKKHCEMTKISLEANGLKGFFIFLQ